MEERSEPQSHVLESECVSLHFLTWGGPSPDRAVLLVHGLASNSHAWVKLAPSLAEEGWFVIAPDLRGRGQSSKPKHGYGINFHATDLLSVCDALHLSRVNLVGHSLGAIIGLYVAAMFPDRLGKLVMVDAGVRVPHDALRAISASVSRLGEVHHSLKDYLEACRSIPHHDWNWFWEQYYRYDAEVRPDGTVASRTPRAVIDEEISANAALNIESLAARVALQTLLVRASRGLLGPNEGQLLPEEEATRLKIVIPGCQTVVIPDTNHYTIVASDRFAEEVNAFLRDGPSF